MLDYKDLLEEIRAELNKLEAGASARLHGLLDQLTAHVGPVEAEVKTDAETVAHDAAPVVDEAVKDAEHVAGEVAAEIPAAVETAVQA